MRARAYVFADGTGLCCYGAVKSAFWEAVATASGETAEQGPWSQSVPHVRPRRSARRPRDFNEVKADRLQLNMAMRESELEFRLGLTAQPEIDLAEVEGQAELFVNLHGVEIWNLAFRLFRDGAAGVPAC